MNSVVARVACGCFASLALATPAQAGFISGTYTAYVHIQGYQFDELNARGTSINQNIGVPGTLDQTMTGPFGMTTHVEVGATPLILPRWRGVILDPDSRMTQQRNVQHPDWDTTAGSVTLTSRWTNNVIQEAGEAFVGLLNLDVYGYVAPGDKITLSYSVAVGLTNNNGNSFANSLTVSAVHKEFSTPGYFHWSDHRSGKWITPWGLGVRGYAQGDLNLGWDIVSGNQGGVSWIGFSDPDIGLLSSPNGPYPLPLPGSVVLALTGAIPFLAVRLRIGAGQSIVTLAGHKGVGRRNTGC